jgi:hypothetical protein
MARSYVADIAGGTATVTIQCQARQTFRNWTITALNAAAGKIELSTSATSQIGTAQPDSTVIARVSMGSAAAGNAPVAVNVPINVPVIAFQNVYVHCTGAGNLGTSILSS